MMKRLKLSKSELVFIVSMFLCFLTLAMVIPFNGAPDEYARYLIPQFINKHMTLPMGTDSEVIIPLWGISYAYSPMFSYIIGGVFMKLVSFVTISESCLLLAARFASVLFSSITVFFTIRIANALFRGSSKWIFITLVTTFPCFMFISSYVNNDALAIMSTSIIIYAWILGLKEDWNRKSIIILIIGLSLCGLSYQNAYGFLLTTILLYIFELTKKTRFRKKEVLLFLKKGVIVFFATFLIGGSAYIRNYILYDGDIMGSTVQLEMAEKLATDDLKPSNRKSLADNKVSLPGMLYNMGWLESTYKSFIGIFGYMNLPMPNFFYEVYNIIFVLGIGGCLIFIRKKAKSMSSSQKLICSLFLANIFIAIMINFIYSYTSDFQPQGRYSLAALIPLMYFIAKGISNMFNLFKNKYQNIGKACFAIGLLLNQLMIIICVFIANYI